MNHSQQLRLGVIGLGNIGLQHIAQIQNGHVADCSITAVCSRQPHAIAEELSAQHFKDYEDLIDSGLVDAVLVATPTFTHFDIGMKALSNNLHVLMEKPIGLSGFEGYRLLDAAGESTIFAVMLNQRTDPLYQKMKQVLSAGILGEIQRTHWTMTNWFRPEIYYHSSNWRATWRGEGGGLLVNQCIHNLDIFQWVCGMPSSVNAQCGFGKFHQIEVEDEATACFGYKNGATGVFIGSTGEAPGVNRFDIIGDLGMLSFDGETLMHFVNQPGARQFNRETTEMFGSPEVIRSDITPDRNVNQHALVISNFVSAILNGEELIAAAAESIDSLNLANGILLSSWRNEEIGFPIDTQEYHEKLAKHIAASQLRQKSEADVIIDMQKSYH